MTTLSSLFPGFSVVNDAEVLALASVTSAANKLPYFTGAGSATVTDLTAFGRSLIDDADAAAAAITLGLAASATTDTTSAANITSGTLSAARLPAFTGDATSTAGTSVLTLANSGVVAGTYNNSATAVSPFTVDSKGRLTSVGAAVTITPTFASITSRPTTLSGYGITDALTNSTTSTQSGYFGDIFLFDDATPSHYLAITNSANLTAARTLSVNVNDADRTISLSGNLTVSAAATVSGTNTGDQTITLTGDVTGTGTGSFATTLANSGVVVGTYQSVTVDAKGRVTGGTNPGYITGNQTITVSGDATGSGTTAITLTLANSGVGAGTYQSVTVDAKGRVTAGTNPTTLAGHGITDAYTKTEVDSLVQGLDVKASVRVATTANITLSGTQTIDGVSVVANDRVLVKDQSTASQNGVYVASASAWTRATDFDSWAEIPGAFFFVEEGTVNGDNGFTCTSNAGGTLGTTAITFTQFSGAGQIVAGTGLTKSGNTLSITNTTVTAASYGSASQVATFTVNAQGQLTAAANTAISITSGAVSGLAASATTDTTNATNISSGTLNVLRTPAYTGDVTKPSGSGTTTIANGVVTYAKIQNVSVTDRVLGRSSAGAGVVEEIPLTSFGRSLIDDADAATARTTLGLGTIATQAASNVSITGGSITGITDLAVADGGTGASTAATARTNLGLAIGTDVQAYSARLADIAGISPVQGDIIYYNGTNWVRLAAGTSGQYLKTQGSAANPVWDSVPIPTASAQTANFNAVAGMTYLVDTTTASVTATLPASPATGDTIRFVDAVATGTWATNNFIVGRNGNNIAGAALNLTCSTSKAWVELTFRSGQGWLVVDAGYIL